MQRDSAIYHTAGRNVEKEPSLRTLNVKLAAPSQPDSSMKWAMVFIESISEKVSPDAKGAVFTNRMRIGVHLYQTPPAARHKEMQLLRFESLKDSVNQYKLVCRNNGAIRLECKTYLELSPLGEGKPDARGRPCISRVSGAGTAHHL